MAGNWSVKLHKNDTPKFPSICVGCGATPTTHIKVRGNAVGWWSFVRFGWVYGMLSGRGFSVPACEPCAKRLRGERWKRGALLWSFAIAGAVIGVWLFGDLEGVARRMAIMGIAVIIGLPYIAYETFFPPTVDITVTESTVTFEFKDQGYAQQFANENNPIV